MAWFRSFWRDEPGQGLAEYSIILALIAVAVVLMIAPFRGAIIGIFTKVAAALGAL